MATIPARYSYLKNAGTPQIVVEALAEFGTLEGGGGTNNPKIIRWADEVAKASGTSYNEWAADWYNSDAVPWCGLFAAVCAVRSANGKADRMPPRNYLAAASWSSWGIPVQFKGREGLRLNEILVGDVAVFSRTGGNHVAIIVAVSKDGKFVHCIGGNQDNSVSIKSFPVGRLYAVRRPRYAVRPVGARHVRLDSRGEISNSQS